MKKMLPKINIFIIIFSIILCIIYMQLYFINKDYLMVLGSIIGILLVFLMNVIENIFKIKISYSVKTAYLIFIFLSSILGMVVNLYQHIIYYDKIIHFFSGVYISWLFIFGYYHFYKRIKASSIFIVTYMMSLNASLALLWEFWEYAMDIILGTNFQKGLSDTMEDAFLAVIGGLIVALIYLFSENKIKNI